MVTRRQLRDRLRILHGIDRRFVSFKADALAVIGDAGIFSQRMATGRQNKQGDKMRCFVHGLCSYCEVN